MVSDPGISRTNIDLRTTLRARHKIPHEYDLYGRRLALWTRLCAGWPALHKIILLLFGGSKNVTINEYDL